MKTLLLTFVLSLFCACSFSQKITGKWSCDKEVVQALRLEYNDIHCTYKFKKDGTFLFIIKGETEYNKCKELGKIKIKGKYVVQEGTISSLVTSSGIETEAQMILDENLIVAGVALKADALNTFYDYQVSYEKETPQILMNIILQHNYLWDWDKEPISITKKELKICKIIKCRR